MLNIPTFKEMACAFPEATEEPHFEKLSYRVKKKIFATLDADKEIVVLKLSEIDQSVFCSLDKAAIYSVNGAWGKQGWTIFELNKIEKELLQDALTLAYCHVAPKKLAALLNQAKDKP